jgi:hypothetical protein
MAEELIRGRNTVNFLFDDMHNAIKELEREFPGVVQSGSIG